MTEEEIKYFSDKFDEYDKDNSGFLKLDKFVSLYRDLENDQNKTKKEAEVVFNGIDINNDKKVLKDEFLDLVKSNKGDDKLFLFKVIFRSFDANRSRTLEVNEIMKYSEFCKNPMTKEQAEQFIQARNIDDQKKTLTFAQLYKLLTEI
jgi:Ca2+-binding EF-hand superfamily protein